MSDTSLSLADATARVDPRHWRVVEGSLRTSFATGDFMGGLDFIAKVAEAAERAQHHPDIDLRYGRVHVALVSHDVGALTERDTALAAEISAIADELGIEGEPGMPRRITIGIDTLDAETIRPFWRAALAYADVDGDLVDPEGIAPAVWFQSMEEPRAQRNRLHLDILVPVDAAEQRVAEVIEAGGTLLTDRFAPSWWVLADAEGNEACICTEMPPPTAD
ncbi:4a-hydroxytetrahydrobiopterin dehydratase [Aeromicrobium sp. YIM 150415]|uniref:VOC family protein n=1 Tax=Aeromicrobium sp. YIM 150415 TaxID=2803912 RepID=UPI0019651441|nr:VOC family protein [Aeromicrobium sp. YIM 150415]MBM9463972.1 4a-hydroxytetrahydrobiopterin dehydratase [Aeromicrobium sp. YIM 150415]